MQLFTPLTLAMLVANQAAAFIAPQGTTIHSPGCHCNCNTCATSTTSLSSLQKYADELKETQRLYVDLDKVCSLVMKVLAQSASSSGEY